METKTTVLLILAAFVAFVLSVFQYLYKKEKSRLHYWLSFFRFLSLFLIFILIINPSFNKKTTELIKPNLFIAVDNSSSIKLMGQADNVKSLVQKIADNNTLNNKFNINYYSFGKTVNALDSLNFSDGETNLFAPLNELARLYPQSANPIVLISDGNQTSGKSVALANYNSAVYTVVVGDTVKVDDIFISKLNLNKTTFLNNKFPIEVFINYQGEKNVTKEFAVYHNNQKVFSKQFNFSSANNVVSEVFNLTASQPGKQYYRAVIQELENENNVLNNVYNFNIDVINDKSEILIVTSTNHPDLGAFKKSIESSGQRNVSIVDIKNFPENTAKYNLIILYQPQRSFSTVFDKLNEEEINYFIVTGLATDWNFLNSAQKEFSKTSSNLNENYGAVLNNDYLGFLTDNIDFDNFPPLIDYFGELSFSKAANAILFQKIGAVETDIPLMATFESEFQKKGVLLGENIWKWRMQVFLNEGSFEPFDNFMSQWVQYMSNDSAKKRLNINSNAVYYSNETIEISAIYFDNNFQFDPRAKIWINVINEETNNELNLPFSLQTNKYSVVLNNLPAGKYNFEASLANGSQLVKGNFIVLPFELEQQFTRANFNILWGLANKFEGKTYLLDNSNELLEDLEVNNKFNTIQKVTKQKLPIIQWKWLLALIVLFLSAEWFTRKYFGKI